MLQYLMQVNIVFPKTPVRDKISISRLILRYNLFNVMIISCFSFYAIFNQTAILFSETPSKKSDKLRWPNVKTECQNISFC